MLLCSPDPKQKAVEVAGATFYRTKAGFFELPNESCVIDPLLGAGWTVFEQEFKPGEVTVPDNVKSAEFHATVIRCTCPEGQGLINHPGQSCPSGRVQDLGIVASFYRNPITRFWKRLERRFLSQKGH